MVEAKHRQVRAGLQEEPLDKLRHPYVRFSRDPQDQSSSSSTSDNACSRPRSGGVISSTDHMFYSHQTYISHSHSARLFVGAFALLSAQGRKATIALRPRRFPSLLNYF
ncbi:hypothetical protein GY45DRAFT_311370 [Cubamyces sp. BRFM 1775]|nr:hypothetical protein GY45DRAFT_311370 [Cubamyces sp. BRFM 1775]